MYEKTKMSFKSICLYPATKWWKSELSGINLLINQGRKIVLSKHFIGYVKELAGGETFYPFEYFFFFFVSMVVQKAFSHVERIVLKIVSGHPYLSDDLFFAAASCNSVKAFSRIFFSSLCTNEIQWSASCRSQPK